MKVLGEAQLARGGRRAGPERTLEPAAGPGLGRYGLPELHIQDALGKALGGARPTQSQTVQLLESSGEARLM